MAEKKTTQREYFEAIIKVLNGEEVAFTTEELTDFVQTRIAQLAKKSADKGSNEALTAFRAEVYDAVVEAHKPMTASEVLSAIGTPDGVSLPKVTSALTYHKDMKNLEQAKVKGKSFYFLPGTWSPEDDEE